MFTSFILLISATLGFLCTAFIYGKNKLTENSLINKYLIIIIIFTALRFLFHGIPQAYINIGIQLVTTILDVCFVAIMPCIYLYFQNIVYENKFNLPHLFHFVAPFLLITVFGLTFFVSNELGDVLKKVFFIIAILCYLTYAYLIFKLLYKNIWNRKSEINAVQQQNDIIKKWSFFLFFFFLTVLLFRFITGIISDKPGSFNNDFLWIPALIWASVFVKIILTPEILYGYNFLNKTIDEAAEKLVLGSIWKLNGPVQSITSEKDKKLEEKMLSLLPDYIHKMEELSFHSETFRKQDLSMEDIANTLKIPISHLNFLFKYHCKESFTDFKKIVRIYDATKLLEGGYLNANTIESLSTAVGFSSYNTFYVAFKSITGITTQDYVKRK